MTCDFNKKSRDINLSTEVGCALKKKQLSEVELLLWMGLLPI